MIEITFPNKKPKFLSFKSSASGLKLPGFIALYLGLEHVTAHSFWYWALGFLFCLNLLILAYQKFCCEEVTIEQIIEQSKQQ